MTVHVVSSLTALACYIVLAFVTMRRGLRVRVNRYFTFYLLTMVFWQITALMVSLSNDIPTASTWYKLMIAGVAGQFLIYFLFTQAILQTRQRVLSAAGLGAWILTVILIASGTPHFL